MRIAAILSLCSCALLLPTRIASAQAVTDPQIAAIVVTANQVDIDAGKLALSRASSAEVRTFAQLMVTDHTNVNKLAADLASKLKLTPADNPTSRSLKDGGDRNRARLTTLQGAAFDKAYVAQEVVYHQQVLDALDQVLIPGASNPELKALLVKVRPAIAAHLEHAKQLQGALGAEAVASSRPAPKTHTVTIAEMRFQPDGLPVAPGDLVVWVNKDIVAHTATAAGTFDSRTIEPTQSWSYRVRRTGTFAYVCALHPTMKGMLRVK